MAVPCVRVAREEGEVTRQALAEAGLLDDAYEIISEEGNLYLPVTAPDRVPSQFDVVRRDLPEREEQRMPSDLISGEVSYERLGDIAILDEDDPDRAQELAAAIMASDLPIRTVLDRASKVQGERRVRDWTILAGDGTETVHREFGCEFAVDLASVYFSPRLATERHRVVTQAVEGEHALDMFAGVGPFVIPLAVRGAHSVGVDLNPTAIEYLRENAGRNGVVDRVTAIEGDVREVTDAYTNWADRLVMNLPHSADEFLETAIRLAGDDCVVHYYDIQSDDDPFGPGTAAIRRAAGGRYDVTIETERVVRSYAPHELNVVIDARLQR